MRKLMALIAVLDLAGMLIACKSSGGKSTGTPVRTSARLTQITTPASTAKPIPTVGGQPTVTSTGLKIIDIQVGTGAEAKATDTVTAQYTGYLADGTIFDGPAIHGGPAQFPLNGVIQGWQEGVPGMKIGGKRRLIIPPALGYGAQGYPPKIPPNPTLTFDIELVSIP